MDQSKVIEGLELLSQGKVRELYDLGSDRILIVASDRISAYDVVLPTEIPDKGRVLTGLSAFWMEQLADVAPTHMVSTDVADLPGWLPVDDFSWLEGRAMLCRRAEPLPIECIVRGWLAGSGWREYERTGQVCGVELPTGLREGEELPEPIFTPSTKATEGHDEPLTFEQAAQLVGLSTAEQARQITVNAYEAARDRAREAGVLIADTKLELGWIDGELAIIDELVTPDSSRFWLADQHQPGARQEAWDKQLVRDWLDDYGWDHTPPAPELPDHVVDETRRRYVEIHERLTGATVPGAEG